MAEYPTNLIAFEEWFRTDAQCREHLERMRWPDGFRCPRCGHPSGWKTGRSGLWECANCRHQTTVTAGTILEGTRKSLRLWFLAMWLIVSEKNGISAKGLQRQLGFSRYETVWTWLHKLRQAMVRPGRDLLSGSVEIDETSVGGKAEGKRGRGADKKHIVVIAAEEAGNGIGRIRLRRIDDVSQASLLPFIQEVIEPRAVIHTDGWKAYGRLPTLGYTHNVTVVKRSEELASELLPSVHRVASLLKRWLLGTWALIRARLVGHIWTITLTSSHSGSIGELRDIVACSSIGWCNRRCRSIRSRGKRSHRENQANLSEPDTSLLHFGWHALTP